MYKFLRAGQQRLCAHKFRLAVKRHALIGVPAVMPPAGDLVYADRLLVRVAGVDYRKRVGVAVINRVVYVKTDTESVFSH